jgi:signal transduction histidine kinase
MPRKRQQRTSETTRARFSVRNRAIAGLAVIVIAFTGLLVYSIWLYRQTVAELGLINTTYLPLTLGTSEIRATQLVFNTQMDRLVDDPGQSITRDWIDAARRYRPTTLRRLVKVINNTLEEEIGADEEEFLVEMARRLEEVERRYVENESRFAELYSLMDTGQTLEARTQIEQLKRSERFLDKVLAGIGEEVGRHITETAESAESDGVRATLGLAVLTLAALLIGAAIVLSTNRLLVPLRRLQEAVARVSRGELHTRIEVGRKDEIGALAADFNLMTDALAERDQMLIRSERLATAGKMAAQVTHEIRNPLSSLALNAELLEEELTEGADIAESRALLRAMQDEIERLTGITESYLRFARLPSPRPDFEDLNETVVGALDFMRGELEDRGIDVRVDLQERMQEVLLDRGQLRQALINLLRNAREAMPDGGAVTVSTRKLDQRAQLVVSDTGPGIPLDEQDQIFDTFYTTKSSGTGLGLPLVRQICLAHGGDVEYEDNQGGGSRFVISLPLGDRAADDRERTDDR